MGIGSESGQPSAQHVVSDRAFDALFPGWADALRATHGKRPAADTAVARSVSGNDADRRFDDGVRTALKRAAGRRPRPGEGSVLHRKCEALLEVLRRHCPDVVPSGPVPTGEVTLGIEFDEETIGSLVLAAVGVEDRRRRNRVIWEQAGSELLVDLARTRVAVLDGLVLVGVSVATDQTEQVEVTVPFAVGSAERLTGMVVTTEPAPRGPEMIVDRWGDALIAFAWQVVVDIVDGVAAKAGVDENGEPLVPGAIVAERGRLRVVPQARHALERTRR